MLTNKHIDKICVIVLILAIVVTVVFMNGERLGIEPLIDPDAEAYSDEERFTDNDLSVDWERPSVQQISLSGTTGTGAENKAYFLDGNLYITDGGYFEISGELTDGSIIVDAEKTSKVFLKLDGVNLHNEEDSCIRVEKADKVFLTLAEGSSNELSCGAAFCQEAQERKRKGAIFSRSDLTINGTGSLSITNAYSHGIEANDDMVITGGTITITAAKDGINVNDSFRYCNADLQITASDDGIHSDTEIDIISGSINITDCYEGIEAPYILIADGKIDIVFRDDGLNASVNTGDGVKRPSEMTPGAVGEMAPGDGDEVPFGKDRDKQSNTSDQEKMESPERGEMSEDGQRPGMPEGMTPPGGFGDQMPEGNEMPEGMTPPEGFGGQMPEGNEMPEGMTPPEGFGGQRPEMNQNPGDFGGFGNQEATLDTETDFGKEYGITPNANGCIIIAGGKISITNETGGDVDGIDSNGDIYILGGDITITMAIQGMSEALDYGSENGGVLNVQEGCVTEVNTSTSEANSGGDGSGEFGKGGFGFPRGFRGKNEVPSS